MRAIVLLNATAGALSSMGRDEACRTVSKALCAAGINAEIREVSGERLSIEATQAAASSVNVVIAAGGDGTTSTIARALAGGPVPLGILPVGTLNHFAKDLGIPIDLESAARVIAAGKTEAVDMAEVNEHTFINNSSIGVYPHFVLDRDTYQRRHGLQKWTAFGIAILSLIRRFPMVTVQIETGTETITRKTPLVFIGNNTYDLDLLFIGSRASLNQGKLSLYIANVQTRWGVLMLIVRTAFGRLRQSRDFLSFSLTTCRISTQHHRLHVALDGEVLQLPPPLEYRVKAGVLRVIVP